LHAESFYYNPQKGIYGFDRTILNFERYSYIITYGQKIEKLSYSVWDVIDTPIFTGAKVGHMFLEEEFNPSKVYIYRIPKIRIENDINDLDRPWD